METWVASHQRQIMGEFDELLRIPNVGTDHANIRRNAEFIRGLLERHGMQAELLETAGNPLVYAERNVPGAARTVLYYIHYDGQPVDVSRWKTDPFRPVHGRWRTGNRQLGRAREVSRRLADLCALGVGRQSADCGLLRGHGCATGQIRQQYPRGDRRRGGDGISQPDGGHRAVPRQAEGFAAADSGRPGAPQRAADAGLRRARYCDARPDGLRAEDGAAQRPLRQLDSQPGDPAGATAGIHEGRTGPHHHRGILRGCAAAHRGARGACCGRFPTTSRRC